MRIGIMMHLLRPGGGSYQMLSLARQLMRSGHRVYVFTYYDPHPDWLVSWEDIEIVSGKKIYYEPPREFSLFGFMRYVAHLISVTFTLLKISYNYKLDVVNPHEWPSGWAGSLTALLRRIPSVWMCNDVWHIPGYEESQEKRIVFYWGSKLVVHPLDRLLTSFHATITVLDHRILDIVTRTYSTDACVIRSGIDLGSYENIPHKHESRAIWNVKPEAIMCLCLSIFHPHRKFEDVIKAFAAIELKHLSLWIVGNSAYDPHYARFIKKMVSKIGLSDRITILDRRVTEIEKQQLLSSADIFIFPNEKQTWGLAVIEAMAVAKPVIVSNGAGVHEVIEHLKTGLIYESGDIESLQYCMRTLVCDDNMRENMGVSARAMVKSRFSWENYSQNMINLFNSAGK
jgi:glycosyltransferase involved in cell wall biosynthesis